jgi:hypothetical protein
MRILLSTFLLASLLSVGCKTENQAIAPIWESWDDTSSKLSIETVESLNAIAKDSIFPREDRARAVFKLFANYIRPGFTAEEVHKVLTDTSWLQDTNLFCPLLRTGWRPVSGEMPRDHYCSVILFPDEADKPFGGWGIEIIISSSGHPLEKEALAFLRGETMLEKNARIIEFALCFPGEQNLGRYRRRFEKFGVRGAHVYQYP